MVTGPADVQASRGPWGPEGVEVGSFKTQEYEDLVAHGYWARVLRAATPPRVAWDDTATQIFERWDQVVGGRGPWHDYVAVKVMKPEHLGALDVYETFASEADYLLRLADTGVVNPLLEFGLADAQPEGGGGRFATRPYADVAAYMDAMERACEDGEVPYLVLGYLPAECSLYRILRLPADGVSAALTLPEKLDLTESFLAFLAEAQERGIYYDDHKLEHVAWLSGTGGGCLAMIDLNGCNPLLRDAEKVARDIIHGFVAVLYPLFVGRLVDGSAIRPRNSTEPRLQALAREVPWDPGTRRVLFHGHELDPVLQLLLSWGMAPEESAAEGQPAKAELVQEVAGVLQVAPAKLDVGTQGARAPLAAFRAYRQRLEADSQLWSALLRMTELGRDVQRSIARARSLSEAIVVTREQAREQPLVTAEVRRIRRAMLEMSKLQLFPQMPASLDGSRVSREDSDEG